MKKYTLIDHTADIGIKVKGNDLKSLFIHAAQAMFDVIAEGPRAPKNKKKKTLKIALAAPSCEELFIRWLNELISLADCEGVFFTDFTILTISDQHLTAVVQGLPCSEFTGKREVKAATYHQLKLEKTKTGYHAEVIFDV